jgi:transcriptional regulator with XRE-family HTH domain
MLMTDAPRTPEETAEVLAIFSNPDGSKIKMPWNERVKKIEEFWPSVKRLDWNEVFRQDPTVMGRIINDIIKMEAAVPGRPGKRPNVSREETERHLRRLTGEDYTTLPFAEALDELRGDRSVRHLMRILGMSRDHTWRLLVGKKVPTTDDMEIVAEAFEKDPSYFLEYRLAYIVGFIYDRLEQHEDATVLHYRRIKNAAKKVEV